MSTGNFTAGQVPYATDDNTLGRFQTSPFGRTRANDADGPAARTGIGAEAAGTAAAAVATHVGLADPHTQYTLDSAFDDHSARHLPGGADEVLTAATGIAITNDSDLRTLDVNVVTLTQLANLFASHLRDCNANKVGRVL